MPELPDVEVLKRYLDSTSLHQKIENVEVESGQVLKSISSHELESELTGHEFASTDRHGKFMFVEIDNDKWLVLHFGMTGDLKYYKKEDEKPEYGLVEFDFANGYQLAYVMTRKLGEVRLIDDVAEFIDKRDLGPDVMDDDFTFEKFRHILSDRHGMIKSTMMNQSTMAGIGNVYSDEILFQAQVHPKTKVNQMDEDTLREIYDAMYDVLNTAIEKKAKPDKFPGSFITRLRQQEDADCPRCGGTLERIAVSGRNGYYCPQCQNKR